MGRRPYVFELEEAEVAEVGDGEVRGLGGYDDLHQLHRLRPHQIHRRAAAAASATTRHGWRARVPRRVSSRRAAPPSDPWRSDEASRIEIARAERISGGSGGGPIGSSRREEAGERGRKRQPGGPGPCGYYAETWRGRTPVGSLTRGAQVPEFGSGSRILFACGDEEECGFRGGDSD